MSQGENQNDDLKDVIKLNRAAGSGVKSERFCHYKSTLSITQLNVSSSFNYFC